MIEKFLCNLTALNLMTIFENFYRVCLRLIAFCLFCTCNLPNIQVVDKFAKMSKNLFQNFKRLSSLQVLLFLKQLVTENCRKTLEVIYLSLLVSQTLKSREAIFCE